jgi:hypothetical protein
VVSSIFYVDILLYCIQIRFGAFVFSIWNLTSGIRALSLAGSVGKYFYFLQIYFFGKKRGSQHSDMIFVGFGAKFAKSGCISEFLS